MISQSIRKISTSSYNSAKIIPRNLKGKSKSSQEWLTRQLSDPYVEKAKILNYRCRSAFKLTEIDDKYKLFKPGQVIIDCGAAPGSWSQIAAERTNANESNLKTPKGTVISIDLLQIHPIKGAIILGCADFTLSDSQTKIKTLLNGKPVDCILSDMAPNATGVKILDQENIINLCYSVLRFSLEISAVGSNLLMKIWDNADVPKLEKDLLVFYNSVKRIKPKASRSDSAENFLLARDFKKIEK